MRSGVAIRSTFVAAILMGAAGLIFARGGVQAPQTPPAPTRQPQSQPAPATEKKLIELKADNMGPIAPGDSATFLVGNFAAQHNGAVITCDSAVRYSDMHIEFFGNVLINKNTTYIYGDRADYNGEINEARVYSELVKVVDEDATLYTYQFIFNTKDNIGEFGGGGILTNRDNRLESVRGYYYANTRDLICVDQVEMRNDEYQLKGDSVVYNMATDNAFFYDNTNIWNKEGDYLYADRGAYYKIDTLYRVTRNGYVMTPKQEMWGDSIDYFRAENHVRLWNDIQIDDTEHKVLAFGDYGEYWKEPGDAFLTRCPSVVSYDLSQGDSLFMRADSMFLYTINGNIERRAAKLAAADSLRRVKSDSLPQQPMLGGQGELADSLSSPQEYPLSREQMPTDSLAATPGATGAADTLAGTTKPGGVQPASPLTQSPSEEAETTPEVTDTLTVAQHKALLKEAAEKAKAEKKAQDAKIKKQKLDEIAAQRREKTTAKLLAQKAREEKRLTARREKAAAKFEKKAAAAARKGKIIPIDSTALKELDSLIDANMIEQDSLLNLFADSILNKPGLMQPPADSIVAPEFPADSIYRLMQGYHNVKIYRSDFQAVCDSITGYGVDSTLHLYIDPVLWNQNSQITSDLIDIYTVNQQIQRAEFIGSPLMASQIDTTHYNQVAGKTMTAFFHQNQIFRNDVNGNVETIYYMEDGEPPEIVAMGVIESGDCTFFIEDKQVVEIIYRTDPVYNIMPLDKIPPTQDLYLRGFKWQGLRRPTQHEVFDRQIRPSRRTEHESQQQPDFPIMQRIDDYRKQLVEQRRWIDRNDQVDPATAEWMRSLGFEVGQPRPSRTPLE